ncbi:Predicted oxidoreductase [Paenibacillus sophorae]|uniref:Aldo/keto reductase n=1 Tax=Paenibacillus sophorae TaxID=1333845 RepID=A0A1H8R0W3_9BACL|nr:aldo/keto reductase [Paenibacillus sophorae]QWU14906.1 aldo/keto reductase [Paenibacillus sophorae]SEO60105.1 Predicted oxidoreductase [Paenibacillus sophorae]
MKYYQVKGLDKPVSEIILGTGWFNLAPAEQVNELMEAYVASGGNVLDTGRFYGVGKSERVVADWIKSTGKREELVLINKAGHHYVDENNVHYPEVSRVKPECITEDLEYSLNNMQLEYFDMYLLHRDDVTVPVGDLMDRLEQHHKEGKIKAYGVSNWSIERIEESMAYCEAKGYQGISVNNPSYSLARVDTPRWVGAVYADDAYARWHEGKDVFLISWASQAAGFFADIYPTDGTAPADIIAAYFNDENFEKLHRCNILAAEKGQDVEPINVALAYVLSQGFPVAAVAGPRNVKEYLSTLKVLDLKLTPAEVAYLSLQTNSVTA